MSWDTVADVASAVCFLGGAFLAFAAGVGALRFPDLLSRMHAGTKPQVLGLVLVLIGLSLRLRDGSAVWALVLVALFQMLTAPVAAHLVGRAGYRTGKVHSDDLEVDELLRAQEQVVATVTAEQARIERTLNEARPAAPTEPDDGAAPSAAPEPDDDTAAGAAAEQDARPDTGQTGSRTG